MVYLIIGWVLLSQSIRNLFQNREGTELAHLVISTPAVSLDQFCRATLTTGTCVCWFKVYLPMHTCSIGEHHSMVLSHRFSFHFPIIFPSSYKLSLSLVM